MPGKLVHPPAVEVELIRFVDELQTAFVRLIPFQNDFGTSPFEECIRVGRLITEFVRRANTFDS